MNVDDPIYVRCPYCAAPQAIVLEPEAEREFVQDCERCCRPCQVQVRRGPEGRVDVILDRAQ